MKPVFWNKNVVQCQKYSLGFQYGDICWVITDFATIQTNRTCLRYEPFTKGLNSSSQEETWANYFTMVSHKRNIVFTETFIS